MRIEELSKINSSDIKRVSENPDLKTNMLEFGFEIIDLEEVKNNNYNLVGSEYRKTKNIISYLPKKLL